MKRKSIKLVLILAVLIGLGVPQSSFADSSPELMTQLTEYLEGTTGAVAKSDVGGSSAVPEEDSPNECFYFRNFWLRARFQAGFEVPGLAKLVVMPEAELLFQRALPEGWTVYRP